MENAEYSKAIKSQSPTSNAKKDSPEPELNPSVFQCQLMEAKIQSLEAQVKSLQQEVSDYKTLCESLQAPDHESKTSTPIQKVSVPKSLRFGMSAAPSFSFTESQNVSQTSDAVAPTLTPGSKASSPIKGKESSVSASESLQSGRSPAPASSTTEAQNVTQNSDETLDTAESRTQSPSKGTDSSYFKTMMETLSTSHIENVLSGKHSQVKNNKKPKVKTGSKAKRRVKVQPKPKTPVWQPQLEPKTPHRVLSPKVKPPILSPSATRSGHVFKKAQWVTKANMK